LNVAGQHFQELIENNNDNYTVNNIRTLIINRTHPWLLMADNLLTRIVHFIHHLTEEHIECLLLYSLHHVIHLRIGIIDEWHPLINLTLFLPLLVKLIETHPTMKWNVNIIVLLWQLLGSNHYPSNRTHIIHDMIIKMVTNWSSEEVQQVVDIISNMEYKTKSEYDLIQRIAAMTEN
jgi:hypothetical protein